MVPIENKKMIFMKRKNSHWMNHTICVVILILVLSTTGCFESLSNFDLDPEIMRANPYLKKIKLNNESLHNYAFSIIQQNQSTEPASILTQIYRHIVENYHYIPDPEDEEIIQSPFETITKKGGDCEDLSILLISLLENIGITSYLVLTESHAYALAVDINPNSLWPYVEDSLIQQVEKDKDEQIRQVYSDTITLKRKSSWYYGGNGSSLSDSFESLILSYQLSSTRPISVYIVPSIQDFHAFTNKTSFNHVQSCKQEEITELNDSCTMDTYGGIIISNENMRTTYVTINLEQYFKPSFYSLFKNNSISSYNLNGKQSVVLDPTAGVYGYPGYDANVTGEKIAFDPVTKDYVYLD